MNPIEEFKKLANDLIKLAEVIDPRNYEALRTAVLSVLGGEATQAEFVLDFNSDNYPEDERLIEFQQQSHGVHFEYNADLDQAMLPLFDYLCETFDLHYRPGFERHTNTTYGFIESN